MPAKAHRAGQNLSENGLFAAKTDENRIRQQNAQKNLN